MNRVYSLSFCRSEFPSPTDGIYSLWTGICKGRGCCYCVDKAVKRVCDVTLLRHVLVKARRYSLPPFYHWKIHVLGGGGVEEFGFIISEKYENFSRFEFEILRFLHSKLFFFWFLDICAPVIFPIDRWSSLVPTFGLLSLVLECHSFSKCRVKCACHLLFTRCASFLSGWCAFIVAHCLLQGPLALDGKGSRLGEGFLGCKRGSIVMGSILWAASEYSF